MSEQLPGFVHCPACAASGLVRQANELSCAHCGFRYFHNSAATVSLIAEHAGRILLVQRAAEPRAGFFDFPGGFVGWDETLEAALAREVREELGVGIATCHYLCSAANRYPFAGVTYCTTDAYFVGALDDPDTLVPQDDVCDLVWVRPDELDMARLAFDSNRRAVGCYLEKGR